MSGITAPLLASQQTRKPVVEVLFEESNEYGHLRLVGESSPTTNRSVLAATFARVAGDVVVHSYDSQTGEGATALPAGVVSLTTTSSGRRLLTVATLDGLQGSFPVELDGTLAQPSKAGELAALASTVLFGSAEVLAAMEAFALAAGLPAVGVGTPGGGAGGGGSCGAEGTIGCVSAVIGLVGSYVGLAACVGTFGLGCVAALIMHTASVTGLVSCFS